MKVIKFKTIWQAYKVCKGNIISLYNFYDYSDNAWGIRFLKNGNAHNSNGYAIFSFKNKINILKSFCYKGFQVDNSKFNVSSWKKFTKQLKHEERLKLFK